MDRDHNIKKTPQEILNASFDKDFLVLAVEQLGFTGGAMQRIPAKDLAVKITEAGTITYIAKAAPGSLESQAVWQAYKLDASSGLKITYADGDSDFDNVATDLTILSYS